MIHYRGLPAELRYTGPAEEGSLGLFLGGVLVAYLHPEGFMVVPLLEGSIRNQSGGGGKTAGHRKLLAAGVKIRSGPCLSVVRLYEPADATSEADADLVAAAAKDCDKHVNAFKRNKGTRRKAA